MSSVTVNSEAAIFGRLLDAAKENLTSDLARHILTINFPDADRARMRALVVKNQEVELNPDEREELDNFNHVGDLLSLWHSKARIALKQLDVPA